MWCPSCHITQQDLTSCNRILVPLLVGTECGEDKWCHKGHCGSLEALNPVSAVHGDWSNWSPLSHYMCRAQGENFMVTRGESFVDGTRCEGASFGCDGVMDLRYCGSLWGCAEAINSTCSKVDGSFTEGKVEMWLSVAEYISLFDVPLGSTSIRITTKSLYLHNWTDTEYRWTPMLGPCSASCDGGFRWVTHRCSEEFCDNPKVPIPSKNLVGWEASDASLCPVTCGSGRASRKHQRCSVSRWIGYHGEDSQCFGLEKPLPWYSMDATLNEDSILLKKHGQETMDVYVWSPVVGPCSVTCGVSEFRYVCIDFYTKTRIWRRNEGCSPAVTCVTKDNGGFDPLPHSKCRRVDRPQTSKPCGTEPCPVRWRYQPGSCSASCGGGVLQRVLYCARYHQDGETGADCSRSRMQHLPHPKGKNPAMLHPCPPRWKVAEASPCSAACGYGILKQRVVCVLTKPPSIIPCVVNNCFYAWEVSAWRQCSVTCGKWNPEPPRFLHQPENPSASEPRVLRQCPKPITVRGCSANRATWKQRNCGQQAQPG
ncbi:hypothetical protein GDO86_014835 [Hymenochirus boettgeri]|uniref:ADAMTS/ADAMTS-like cysteine-rich domain-containing protein n=1 Tax=Hymenochirus boettgeri TaxID=247094 RepID=A0A8T2JYR6_9PIPI|nr:hypothetical protein GDO86_014835 [Hymenochirus boettgeri]